MKAKPILLLPLVFLFILIASSSGCTGKPETVTIRYAAWNLGSVEGHGLERRMIEAFVQKHPNIKVEIDENFTADYNTAMSAASAGNTLPDVFMYASIPQANSKGLCADITGTAEKDGEWSGIPQPIRDAATVQGRIVAIPSAIYFYGYFCNESLFEARGIPAPKPGFSVGGFQSAIADMTDIPNKSVGLAEMNDVIDWYPASASARLGWYSWDGGKLNLNSKEFIDGVKLAKSINENGQVFSPLSEDQKKSLNASNDWEAWNAGEVALKFDGTWVINDYSKLGFKVGFLGIPGGRACIVPDFLFISKSSGHASEAYEFAKYMSAYSREGFAERLKVAKSNGLAVTTIPMVKDKSLINTYFDSIAIDGVRQVYDTLQDNSYVESAKVLPGYDQARWSYVTNIPVGNNKSAKIGDVLSGACAGAVDIDAVADRLNSAANDCIEFFPRQADN